MAITVCDIRKYLTEQDKTKVSHVLIISSVTQDEEYPINILVTEDVSRKIIDWNNITHRVIEVYNLGMEIEKQLKEDKCWNDQQYIQPITTKERLYMKMETKRERSSWAMTWMSMILQYANHRSMDPATRHGCVLVDKDNKLLSIGYNSFPRDCVDNELPLTRPEKYEVIIHAETNAIINAERSLDGATAYITGYPCPRCFSNLLNAKICKIIYGPIGSHQLRDSDMDLIKQLNISADTLNQKIEIIKFEDIDSLEKLCQSYDNTKEYIQHKIEQKDLING